MANKDLYLNIDAPSSVRPLTGQVGVLQAELLGSDFTGLGESTDTFKLFKLLKFQQVISVQAIVTDADGSAATVDIGYTDGTNTSADYFDTTLELTAVNVEAAVVDQGLVCLSDNMFITIVPNDTLESDTSFILQVKVLDLTPFYTNVTTTSTSAPITQP